MKRRNALRSALKGPVLLRSLAVGVIVGTILNLINQGDAMLGEAPIIWWRLCLTYCVPFCVATYGAYSALLERRDPPVGL